MQKPLIGFHIKKSRLCAGLRKPCCGAAVIEGLAGQKGGVEICRGLDLRRDHHHGRGGEGAGFGGRCGRLLAPRQAELRPIRGNDPIGLQEKQRRHAQKQDHGQYNGGRL